MWVPIRRKYDIYNIVTDRPTDHRLERLPGGFVDLKCQTRSWIIGDLGSSNRYAMFFWLMFDRQIAHFSGLRKSLKEDVHSIGSSTSATRIPQRQKCNVSGVDGSSWLPCSCLYVLLDSSEIPRATELHGQRTGLWNHRVRWSKAKQDQTPPPFWADNTFFHTSRSFTSLLYNAPL